MAASFRHRGISDTIAKANTKTKNTKKKNHCRLCIAIILCPCIILDVFITPRKLSENVVGKHSDKNPFTPGAGHPPPFLAGRDSEIAEFSKFLDQETVMRNVILTGLRGTGKTVLMDGKYKPAAQDKGWVWVGSDFSESSFLSEAKFCQRLLTDLSVFTSTAALAAESGSLGFTSQPNTQRMDYNFLWQFFELQPGLTADKLKATLEFVWKTVVVNSKTTEGIVFAYDEAQVVQDRDSKEEYPLAVMLETFQSLQRKGCRFLLLLTGLPTLFPRLVESRTYAERMFTIQELGRLTPEDSRDAISVPTKGNAYSFTEAGVEQIIKTSDGYPYFIQFICRETFDHLKANPDDLTIPLDSIVRKLDTDFFAGRWETLTDRQRDLLYCVSSLPESEEEFSIIDIVEGSKATDRIKSFTPGDVSQMLPRLIEKGLIYKNRLGKYCFSVPLFNRFIRRKLEQKETQPRLFPD
ncbi:hypothetical protein Q31b_42410 [Novipirellula aureliae]|uniref:Archaeal ATPase n=1 Tax=Novipirellula aureliae TaxID=2527966 RepID=A0A5C6DVT1_9BACT|nr:ATP-binding protein [Novipirellula aureliae]TWU39156.1 hypothetical protein Q31b_42410 [Novipirellula aureliae]